jgi:hypothetical protein
MKKIVKTTPDPEVNIPDSDQTQKKGKPKEPPPLPPGVTSASMQEEPAPEELRSSADRETQLDEPSTSDVDG